MKDAEQSQLSLVEHLAMCLGGKFVYVPTDINGTCPSMLCSIQASTLPPDLVVASDIQMLFLLHMCEFGKPTSAGSLFTQKECVSEEM